VYHNKHGSVSGFLPPRSSRVAASEPVILPDERYFHQFAIGATLTL
jgi:hypothetical protein